jgi:hypothetical protein
MYIYYEDNHNNMIILTYITSCLETSIDIAGCAKLLAAYFIKSLISILI